MRIPGIAWILNRCGSVCWPRLALATDAHPATEGGAAAVPADVPINSIAVLAAHLLRDGELVLLILRPSRWFILLTSLKFLASVTLLMILTVLLDDRHSQRHIYIEIAVFIMAGRLMWAILQWMGRLYILTDMRILRLSGVFGIDVFDCALRRVARTLLDVTVKEGLCRIGSIVIIPQDEQCPIGIWQMVAHPREVHRQILATITRAKQGAQ